MNAVETDDIGKRLILLNHYPFPSAVYRYATDIRTAFNMLPTVINLVYDKKKWDKRTDGRTVNCAFSSLNGTFTNLSRVLPKFSYGKRLNQILSKLPFEPLIHYTSEFIYPVTDGQNEVVTVFENPKAFLYTSLYYSDESRFRFVSRHYYLRLYKELAKKPFILTGSNYVKKALLEFGFQGKVEAITPPVSGHFKMIQNKMEIRKKLGLPRDKTLILSVSTNIQRKNLQMLQKMIEKLGADYKIVRVGDAVADSITFKGVDNETINLIYNACDLLFDPTIEEGSAELVLEAFAAGIPVAASDIEVVREISGDAAVLFDPYDASAAKIAIERAIDEKQLYVAKGQRIVREYSIQNFHTRLTNFYRSIY